ncbi:MAG: SAM-dependent chlorinase/fluorinase [Armatimonadota bacterium]|nr:SAM-dependent chlorinase/fluorinase [Armatimonadota bacterium]MDW8024692.1 SAM-dependent chlorinase/fluorinase [Armatimonadota bacterium]
MSGLKRHIGSGYPSRPVIALLTDFGYSDGYVGTMKGVIASIIPDALVIDITHGIQPQSITSAALILWGSYRYFPHGTIHCVVVDPTVGTERRPIAVRTSRYTFVGPDNGVLSWAFDEDGVELAVHITNRKFMLPFLSQTFHGRDVFAPVAAHIATGVELKELGEEVPNSSLKRLTKLSAKRRGKSLIAKVVHIDLFGNAITNLHIGQFERWLKNVAQGAWRARIGEVEFKMLSTAYADVPVGEPLIIFNSYGLLEVAVNCGNAAREINISVGDELVIEPLK